MSIILDKSSALHLIGTINSVEGFDPAVFAVEYTDLNTSETRKRLPVMAQLAWFRLKYPEGRIAVTAIAQSDHFVAHARVYGNYQDPVDCFLAEASVSRAPSAEKPGVSPREWAETAAVGRALRNAGFGLQFDAAGDAFDTPAVDELGGTPSSPNGSLQTDSATGTEYSPAPANDVPEAKPKPLTFDDALIVMCPISKHAGKTLGEVLRIDPSAINWLATKYKGDEKVLAAARLICEASQEVA